MSATARILKISMMFLGVLLVSACGGGSGTDPGTDPANTSIARVVITPGSALLTEVGDTQSLTAQAFDASGNPLPATFTWTSSKPEIVTVDGNGKITAAALGSTQIVAEAAGIRSVSALVAVAMPALGVVMIDDSQVVSAPAVTDPTARFDVGMQYQVTLSGIAPPAIGTLISGNGAQPVAGRVVAVQKSGSNVILTLAIVPVAELFPDLAIDESIDLTQAKIIVPTEVTEHFTVTEHADGSVEYKPKNGDSVTFSGGGDLAAPQSLSTSLSPASLSPAGAEATPGKKEFKVGPFECEASLTFPLINITLGALRHEKTLREDIRHDPVTDTITRLAVVGDIKVEAKSQISIAGAAEGAAECKVELGAVPVPLPGPLALLRTQIPFGLGLGAGGKLTIANLGYEAVASAEAGLELGLSCPVAGQDCEFLHTVTGKAEGDTKPVLPPVATNLDAALRIEPEFALFAFADIIVKPFNIEQLKAELLAAKAGIKVAANLSTVVGQLADSAYQSDYKLTLETVAGTGKEISSLFNFVQLTVLQAEFKNTVPLSQSPAASAFTTQSSGGAHTFTVDLDPQTLTWPMFPDGTPPTTVVGIPIPEFLYNVDELKIFQKQVTADGAIEPVLVASQLATDNQTHFVLQATAPAASGDFFAFVRTRFLPLPVIGDLELGGAVVQQTKIAFVSRRDGNDEIYVMNADGSGQTNLTNNAVADIEPAWSPDGTRIAFVSTRNGGAEIYVMNADGSGPTQITNTLGGGFEPAWSPDGTRIAFVRVNDIFVMNADGSGQTNLTNSASVSNFEPAWSPDGTRIAFASVNDIHVMNADGSGRTNLSNNAAVDSEPAWSPDGTRIAFASGNDIHVMNADGSGRTKLTNDPVNEVTIKRDPTWSPDGTHIAFASDKFIEFDTDIDIFVMNADGSGKTSLTNNAVEDSNPAWSPK